MISMNKTTTEKVSIEPPMGEELYTGYLHKSPFLSTFSKGIKSWKRRFFVLSKTGENTYHLSYYRNKEKRERPVGEINLSKVSLICTCPEKHQMWDWIQKNFKCSSASVLILRVEDYMPKSARDYFLIGENGEEVDGWLNKLLQVLNTETSDYKVTVSDDSLQQDYRYRTISAPVCVSQAGDEEYDSCQNKTEFHLSEQSKSPCIFTSPPSVFSRKLSDVTLSDDDNDDTEEKPEDKSEYMAMAAVHEGLEQEEEENVQTKSLSVLFNESTNIAEPLQDLCDADKNKDSPMKQDSTEQRCSNGSPTEMNGNEFTEMNKSETPTLVEKEISVTKDDLTKSLIIREEQGKLCVSECKKIETSHVFHKGDQILALNDLLIDSVEEMKTFIKRLSKDEVKLTVLRELGSQPLHDESYKPH